MPYSASICSMSLLLPPPPPLTSTIRTSLCRRHLEEGEDLQAGDHVVRLHTRTDNACVGVGVVQEYKGQVSGRTGILLVPAMTTRARVRRWIVRVDEVWMPGAHTLYPNSDDVGTGNARGRMEGKEEGLAVGR